MNAMISQIARHKDCYMMVIKPNRHDITAREIFMTILSPKNV